MGASGTASPDGAQALESHGPSEAAAPSAWRLKLVSFVVLVVGLIADLVSKAHFATLLQMDPRPTDPIGPRST